MPKILSIEIDNEIIKIVEGLKSIKGELVSINRCLLLSIPLNSIDDGKIIDMDSIKLTIEKALDENNIKTKNAVFIINANIVTTRTIELPLLKSKSETMSMIRLEIEQLLTENSEQMIIFKRAEIIKDDCSNRAKYIVHCLSLDVYNQYIELSKILGIKLMALDISTNFFENIPKKNLKINGKNYFNDTNAFINLGHKKIVFCVLNKGLNDFSRVIRLDQNEYEMYQSYKVAENFEELYKTSPGSEKVEKDFDVNQWVDEISKYIRYYYEIDKDNIIDKIYIYGTCHEIVGLEQYLSYNLNIDVEIIKEISNFVYDYSINDFNLIEYFHAILALFTDKNDVNFLTDKIQYQKFRFNVGVAVMAASLFFVLGVSLYTESSLIKNESLKKEIRTMSLYVNDEENINFNNEIESLKNNIACLEEYNEWAIKVKEIIREEDHINSEIFRELMNAKPNDTSILFITIDGNNIHMQCATSDIEDTMLFLKNLRSVNFIDSIFIPTVEVKKESENEYSYSIICKLKDVVFDESK